MNNCPTENQITGAAVLKSANAAMQPSRPAAPAHTRGQNFHGSHGCSNLAMLVAGLSTLLHLGTRSLGWSDQRLRPHVVGMEKGKPKIYIGMRNSGWTCGSGRFSSYLKKTCPEARGRKHSPGFARSSGRHPVRDSPVIYISLRAAL